MTVYYYSKNINGFVTGKRFSIDEPCVTVMAHGMGGDHHRSWLLAKNEMPEPELHKMDKPPYRVPLMSEVRDIPWNGLTVVSTFAGCGGSSTGYRMAGYRVLLANEFVPIAQESYAANKAPHTIVDGRDIAKVTGADILAQLKMKVGDLDVLDGSPPCQAFSTAGKRDKGWGTERHYEHGASQKNEDLFFEYCRLRDEMMPRAFVAENVSGLVKGAAKGYFIEIMRRLKVGYRVRAQVLDAQWLGVPQARQRVIFVGVREDIGIEPDFPAPLPYRYSVREALPWLTSGAKVPTAGNERDIEAGRRQPWEADEMPSPTVMATEPRYSIEERVIHDTGGFVRGLDFTDRPAPTIMSTAKDATHYTVQSRIVHDTGRGNPQDITDRPSPTITAGPSVVAEGGGPRNHFKVEEDFRVLHDTNGSFRSGGDVTDKPAPTVTAGRNSFSIVGNSNAPHGRKGEERSIDVPAPNILARRSNIDLVTESIVGIGGRGKFGVEQIDSPDLPAATIGTHPNAGNGRSSAGHVYTSKSQKIASRDEVDDDVGASIEGYAIGEQYDNIPQGGKSKKYMNMVKAHEDRPSPTITAGGAGAGGGAPGSTASVVHPSEKRKFTIAELRRICAFPDDFVLKGTYAQQWERLGNSVPPVMMMHVAATLRDKVLLPARARRPERAPRSTGRSTSATPPKGAGTAPPRGARAGTTEAAAPPPARGTPAARRRRAGPAGEAEAT